MAAVVSAGSIDQTGTSAAAWSRSRAPASARVTGGGWGAIAVMGQFQHRPPTVARARNPFVDNGSGTSAVDRIWTSSGPRGLARLDRRWAGSRAGWGGFETVAARPPQPPQDRSQPTGGNPIASLA